MSLNYSLGYYLSRVGRTDEHLGRDLHSAHANCPFALWCNETHTIGTMFELQFLVASIRCEYVDVYDYWYGKEIGRAHV